MHCEIVPGVVYEFVSKNFLLLFLRGRGRDW